MKNASPRLLALYVALAGSAMLGIMLLLLAWLAPISGPWYWPALICITMGWALYALVQFILEKFLYRKIKLVYKTIHQLKSKTPGSNLKNRIRSGGDVIGEVNAEVLQWANRQKSEMEELQKMEAYRRDFIGNLSHELKTPIFNIQGYLSTLVDGGLYDKEIAEKYLQNAEKNVERMISLIEDLDTIHKLESGRVQMDLEKLDLVTLAGDLFELLEMKARNRGVRLQFKDSYSAPIWVRADRNALRQILTNLLVNSIAYGNDNGQTKVSFYDMDDRMLIEVSDDGPGISEEHLNRLFERFYRVDRSRSRNQGGSGLGLSIVKHLVEAHNQTIHARSLPGKGSTFSFTIEKWTA
ncbi:MAG: sensor histidine kinase [Bacteroidetes bacterium]|nr:sensor histidine kinase [Bacteroidota bacterium]